MIVIAGSLRFNTSVHYRFCGLHVCMHPLLCKFIRKCEDANAIVLTGIGVVHMPSFAWTRYENVIEGLLGAL